MRRRLLIILNILIFLLVTNVNIYAETSSKYEVSLTEDKTEYNIFLPFNSQSISVEYSAAADTQMQICVDEKEYSVDLPKRNKAIEYKFDFVERKGERKIRIKKPENVNLISLVFNKEVIDIPTLAVPVRYTLSRYEEAIKNAVIIAENGSVMRVNGSRRYIDMDNNMTPVGINNTNYLPVECLAKALGYYCENIQSEQYVLMRSENLEFVFNGEAAFKQQNGGKKENIDNMVIYQNDHAYLPIRYFAEAMDKTVGYKEGIIIISDSETVANLLNDNSIFSQIKDEFADYVPAKETGNTYYVSQSDNASDSNDGSENAPFKTIKKASEVAMAGDTVIVGKGTYREVLTPQNDGTVTHPITYKAAEGEEVILSALEPVSDFVTYEGNVVIAAIEKDLGKGRNQIFYKGEALREARHPNNNTSNREYPYELNLGPLWPTQGDIKPYKSQYGVAVSDTDLNQDEKDYWKGGIFVSLNYEGWALGTAGIRNSSKGKLELENLTKKWWFARDYAGVEFDTDYGYITGHYNAIDVPGEWVIADDVVYIYPPEGETVQTLALEVKARHLVADLSNSRFVHLKGFKTIGGSVKMNDSELCVIDDCEMRYIAHYTLSQDQRSGYIDDGDTTNPNGAPQRGEVGIYIGGTDNVIINSRIDYSAAAGLYITGKNCLIENNTISNCGYMGSYVGGVFISPDVSKGIENPMGGHGVYYNTIYNSGRNTFNVATSDLWIADKKLGSLLPMEIAYNKVYNGGVLSGRDGGVLYTHGVSAGSDRLKTKIHNNLIYDAWAYDAGHSFNIGIYHDNYSQDIETFSNIIFYTSDISKLSNEVFVQTKQSFPTSFAVVDVWNNSKLGYRASGEEGLTYADYPNGKLFYAGAKNPENVYMENYNNITSDFGWNIAADANVSAGVTLKDGIAQFSGNDQWIEFKNVDFGEGKNQIKISFTGDIYNTGDVAEVIIGDSIETGKKYKAGLKSTSPYLDGKNISSINIGTVNGYQNVYIRCIDYKSMGIEKISTYLNADLILSAMVYGGNFSEFVAGNLGNLPTSLIKVPDDEINPIVNNTWKGTQLKYEDVEISFDSNTLVYMASTAEPYSGNIMEVRLDSPNAEPVAVATIEGSNWNVYSQKEIKLLEPIKAGIYDIYLTFDNAGKSSNLYWFGFKNAEYEEEPTEPKDENLLLDMEFINNKDIAGNWNIERVGTGGAPDE